MDKYTLDGHTPVPAEDLLQWVEWMQNAETSVAVDRVDGATVSTAFLGLDHRHGRSGRPVLFETLVFDGVLDQEMKRYATWDEAEAGHALMLAKVREAGEATAQPLRPQRPSSP